jgi:L-threonylcarbamoyladenylate synthase
MKTEVILANDSLAIQHAVDVFNRNGMVAFPTDTVYGLSAPAFNTNSIDRLYTVKGRNHSKAIAVLLSNLEQMDLVTLKITPSVRRLAKIFWPGPLTMVVNRSHSLPDILSPVQTIGIRIPDHPFALSLIEEIGPLAVTSANVSGQPPPCTAVDVLHQLNHKIHLIIDGGKTPGGIPSTVIDCTASDVKLLRKGPISMEKILSELKLN